MDISGLRATINLPQALISKGESGFEMAHGLPPYAPTPIFRSADFSGIPESWIPDSETERTYFFPVKENIGMWFDFNMNNGGVVYGNTYDVAVVMSVQGINPLTGQPTSHFHLEQYRQKCPLDSTPLTSSGFCKVCGYEWPPQNYLAGSVQGGRFWIDGFRDGKDVRQWVFTQDTARGVAANIIGQKRVFAAGMAFYISSQPRPRPEPVRREFVPESSWSGGDDVLGFSRAKSYGHSTTRSVKPVMRGGGEKGILLGGDEEPSFEIAAGAKIAQRIERDNNPITYWENKPRGILYAYWVSQSEFEAIWPTRIQGSDQGWLAKKNVPVGNPPTSPFNIQE